MEDREVTCHTYTYYLKDEVRCPHCGCKYVDDASKSSNGSYVPYYACLCDRKKKTNIKCPVGRVNAESLHFSVLNEVARAARHKTVMHRLIAESGGWQGATEAQNAVRGQLAKQKQSIEMRQANLLKSIEEGNGSKAILNRLLQLDDELDNVSNELARAEDEVEKAIVKKPTTEQVQAVWQDVLRLWEGATEEERGELMDCLVEQVDVTEKITPPYSCLQL